MIVGAMIVSWNTGPDGDLVTYDIGDSVTLTESLDLYAQWELVLPPTPEPEPPEPLPPESLDENVTLSDDNMLLTFSFYSNPTTGYGWTVTEDPEGILTQLSDEYIPDEVDPEIVGSGGIHTWTYEGNAPGEVTLNFVYARSFEEDSTIEDLTYTIIVNDDYSLEIL